MCRGKKWSDPEAKTAPRVLGTPSEPKASLVTRPTHVYRTNETRRPQVNQARRPHNPERRPRKPTVADVRRAILGVGVTSGVDQAVLSAWEHSAWADAHGLMTGRELEQRAYESAAAALMNATNPSPAPVAPVDPPAPSAPASPARRFEPSKEDAAWWSANSPYRDMEFDVVSHRPIRRETTGRSPSDRYREDEYTENYGSFAGHDA